MFKRFSRPKYKVNSIDSKNEDIDFVFTHVDFKDRKYQQKLITHAKKIDPSILKSKELFLQRYIDFGEIYFSIYTVKKNLPFIRKIFIVTPTPSKIKNIFKNDKQVIVINDEEILKDQNIANPCFKSTVIESYLYLIPNLSNVFLYGCDDMIIANEMNKSSLFYNNIPYIFLDERRHLPRRVKNNISPAFADVINSNIIFENRFGTFYSLSHNHQITVMRKDLCKITHDIFKENIARNNENSFRTPIKNNIHFLLLSSFLGLHLGLLKRGNVKSSGFYEMAYTRPWQRFNNLKYKDIKYFCVNNLDNVYFGYYLYGLLAKFTETSEKKNILFIAKNDIPNENRQNIIKYFNKNLSEYGNFNLHFIKRNFVKNILKSNTNNEYNFDKFLIVNLVNKKDKIDEKLKYFDDKVFYITVLKKNIYQYLPDIIYFLNINIPDKKLNYLRKDKFIFEKKYKLIRINFSNNDKMKIRNTFKYDID